MQFGRCWSGSGVHHPADQLCHVPLHTCVSSTAVVHSTALVWCVTLFTYPFCFPCGCMVHTHHCAPSAVVCGVSTCCRSGSLWLLNRQSALGQPALAMFVCAGSAFDSPSMCTLMAEANGHRVLQEGGAAVPVHKPLWPGCVLPARFMPRTLFTVRIQYYLLTVPAYDELVCCSIIITYLHQLFLPI